MSGWITKIKLALVHYPVSENTSIYNTVNHVISPQALELDAVIVSILQIRGLKCKEVPSLSQVIGTGSEWLSQNWTWTWNSKHALLTCALGHVLLPNSSSLAGSPSHWFDISGEEELNIASPYLFSHPAWAALTHPLRPKLCGILRGGTFLSLPSVVHPSL